MAAIDLDTVRTIAVAATGVFLVIGLVAGVMLKSIAQKAAMMTIFALLALLIWTQRSSLDECAQVVRNSFAIDGDSTCSFLGRQVSVRPDRN
jgi:predicted anti-sigma-YlaC factor YlaD